MAAAVEQEESSISHFLRTGVYRFQQQPADHHHHDGSCNNGEVLFLDPVRILNASYNRYKLSPSSYYSRTPPPALPSSDLLTKPDANGDTQTGKRKRNKKKKKPSTYQLNQRELSAEKRHQEARSVLLKAYQVFVRATDLVKFLPHLRQDESGDVCLEKRPHVKINSELSLIDLGSTWQSSLCEISLHSVALNEEDDHEGTVVLEGSYTTTTLAFNNLVRNWKDDDMKAELFGKWYTFPRRSSFYMSDLLKIHNLIPGSDDERFNLILIDPPWENRSVKSKSRYPMLPNRNLLSLPIRQLMHPDGALVALWVTNREKLRLFVEKELFPAWGLDHVSSFYWLKVREDGELISDLDFFHHKPYECLLIGYSLGKTRGSADNIVLTAPPADQVIISIPGEHSRKPPIGKLLLEYAPGPGPAKCLELFARELISGWTSWGNEPLKFQEMRYFLSDAI